MHRRTSGPMRVVIAGGGVAALEALLALQALAGERVTVDLVAAEPQFWYRPLAVAEPFGTWHVGGLELSAVAERCGALLTLDRLVAVDVDAGRARTAGGAELPYDALVVACGARPREALPGALAFRGFADVDAYRRLLEEALAGDLRSVVFAVPGSVGWSLPLYELALQTQAFLAEHASTGVELTVVTHEPAPLAALGARASRAIAELLAQRGVALVGERYPRRVHDGVLELVPEGEVAADRVVALPRLEAVAIEGLPAGAGGFLDVGLDSRVRGLDDVFAAGDVTSFPIKQGGVAAQQADAAAEAIAARAGAPVKPRPFRPTVRALLLTGALPAFLRSELAGDLEATSEVAGDPLWWPPAKIAARHLGPFLAEHAGALATQDRQHLAYRA
jgi:sulfide:quinone oxidoreductase